MAPTPRTPLRSDGIPRGHVSRKISRGTWSKQLRLWHWVSSALCLVGLLFFTVTGITLNHAGEIEAKPAVREVSATMPPELLALLKAAAEGQARALPDPVSNWVEESFGAAAGDRAVEWSTGEAYIALPRPGGDAWVAISTVSGETTYETTSRGAVSFLNDLHKGRNTGMAWRWFIDAFAVACLVFAVTGLLLLYLHAQSRPSTWPLVGFGLLFPSLLVFFFIH
ncbi:MAG: hypothetical protein GEU87_05890 [Alphaproteobacteria bacterium]|nr:hypothetical protein [Alphaproteobacteria bacterium]